MAKHNLIWHLEGIWLWIHARLVYIHHLIRGHDISYYEDPDLWTGLFGFIICHNCPDTVDPDNEERASLTDLCIWSHHQMWRMRLAQWLCNKCGGHRDFHHAQKWSGELDSNGERIYTDTENLYCGRCIADV